MDKECNEIYGVNPNKKVTPLMVRDAIVECFFCAHTECMKDRTEGMTDEERKKLVVGIIKKSFADSGGDFENPTKKDLMNCIGGLKEIAKTFRNPEIIAKHYREIKSLIDRIEE